jgi:hypothetical protein
LLGLADSGLPGTDGNVEYFLHIARGGAKGLGLDTLEMVVDTTVAHAVKGCRIDEE